MNRNAKHSDKCINSERLARTFMDLVRIDSISKDERALASDLSSRLATLGLETLIDEAGGKIGGNCGNLIARFQGNRDVAPLLLSAHMDTVEPGRGVQPQFKEGIFTSSGDTILGADDKSAVAIILEVLNCIRERNLPCGPLEILLTVAEEIGLLGAKNIDYSSISAKQGYVLDTRSTHVVVTHAPSANHLTLTLFGRSAHAGAEPEKGINAISLAGKAIAGLTLGRIDHETTCNIGKIQGGVATNIVPERVTIHGEVRSHDTQKLGEVTALLVASFERVIAEYRSNDGDGERPRLQIDIQRDFERLNIAADHPVVSRAMRAADRLGHHLQTGSTGGGSDANVFTKQGIDTVVLGTGMENVHTVNELIHLADMVRSAELLLEIIRLHAEER
jgi:tripeptide aminopeptidase